MSNKVTVTIPTSLSEVNLKKYKEFSKAVDSLTNVEDNLLERAKHILLPFVNMELINAMPMKDLERIYLAIIKLMHDKPMLKLIIEIDEKKYGFEPDLNNISVGAYVDLKQCEQNGMTENIDKIMAVLYRPITNQVKEYYSIKTYSGFEGRDKLFNEHMTADVALAAIGFFLNLKEQLSTLLSPSLSEAETTMD